MEKLYFECGAMGSSKTARALITKYNYEENDLNVWRIKSSADTWDGAQILRSYIDMCHRCYIHGIREYKRIQLHGSNEKEIR